MNWQTMHIDVVKIMAVVCSCCTYGLVVLSVFISSCHKATEMTQLIMFVAVRMNVLQIPEAGRSGALTQLRKQC